MPLTPVLLHLTQVAPRAVARRRPAAREGRARGCQPAGLRAGRGPQPSRCRLAVGGWWAVWSRRKLRMRGGQGLRLTLPVLGVCPRAQTWRLEGLAWCPCGPRWWSRGVELSLWASCFVGELRRRGACCCCRCACRCPERTSLAPRNRRSHPALVLGLVLKASSRDHRSRGPQRGLGRPEAASCEAAWDRQVLVLEQPALQAFRQVQQKLYRAAASVLREPALEALHPAPPRSEREWRQGHQK